MKIRKGFVSNSSTSSFMLLSTVENYDKVYNELPDVIKKIVDELGKNSKTVFSKKAYVMEWMEGNIDYFEDMEGVDLDEHPELKDLEIESWEEDGFTACELYHYFVDQICKSEEEAFLNETSDG